MEDDKGFYLAFEYTNEVGLSFSIAYHREQKDFQISFMFLDMAIAIGYVF